ncbi:hypothetical protein H8D51_03375 [bacterium]|nr:hypothetical protein [bacterium]
MNKPILLLQEQDLPGQRLLRTLERISSEVVLMTPAQWLENRSCLPAATVNLILLHIYRDSTGILQQLKSDPDWAGLPLLAILDAPTELSGSDFLELAIDDAVLFPWNEEEVLARVEARLRLRHLEETVLSAYRIDTMYHTARRSVQRVEPGLQTVLRLLNEIEPLFRNNDDNAQLTPQKVRELEQVLQQVAHSIHHLQDISNHNSHSTHTSFSPPPPTAIGL